MAARVRHCVVASPPGGRQSARLLMHYRRVVVGVRTTRGAGATPTRCGAVGATYPPEYPPEYPPLPPPV